MKNFVYYRYTEISLIIIGLILFFLFKKETPSSTSFWKGFGLRIALIALFALTADYFAEQRGKKYLYAIKEFLQKK